MIDFLNPENCTKENFAQLKKSSIEQYLKTGIAKYCSGKTLLFCDSGNNLFIIQDKKVHFLDYDDSYRDALVSKLPIFTETPTAILVPSKAKNRKYDLIRNGDMENDDPAIMTEGKFDTTLSFNCLSLLINAKRDIEDTTPKQDRNVLQRIIDGNIVVVDSTPDVKKTPTKKEKAKIAEEMKKAPEKRMILAPVGFTYVNGVFHMPATVLLQDKTNRSYIFGQDEGTYFGCELLDNPKTIKDAYVSMIPPEIRKKEIKGRQGEWFIVPVNEKDVPKITDCITSDNEIYLPVDDEDSALHSVYGNEIRIKDNKIYAFSGEIQHSQGDHNDQRWSGWATFVHNRVKRSVSQEGVD